MSRLSTIAHLIASNFYGGPEKQILTHALKLDRNRFRILLITFIEQGTSNELAVKAREQGVELFEIRSAFAFDARTISAISSILSKQQVDVLCAHGYKSNVIGRISAWHVKCPHVAISRGWTAENWRIRFYERLDRLFLRHADHIVAVSEGQKSKIAKLGIPPFRISVIHNAIEVDEWISGGAGIRRELGVPDESLLVISAGRLSPEKNHPGMIEVARRVLSQMDDVYFAVFGEGFLRPELESRIASAGLEGRFFLPGFRTDLQSILNEIDIFMLPSFTEGLPNVALEAFAAGKPIVASAVGGTPEVVQDGISGFLTHPDDHDLMAQRLLLLIRDPERRKRMGEAGRTHVLREFGFDKQTELYEKLYRDLVR